MKKLPQKSIISYFRGRFCANFSLIMVLTICLFIQYFKVYFVKLRNYFKVYFNKNREFDKVYFTSEVL